LIISNARVKAWISSKLGTSFAATLDAAVGAEVLAEVGIGAELCGGAAKATPQQTNDKPQTRTNEYRVMGNTEEAT